MLRVPIKYGSLEDMKQGWGLELQCKGVVKMADSEKGKLINYPVLDHPSTDPLPYCAC